MSTKMYRNYHITFSLLYIDYNAAALLFLISA